MHDIEFMKQALELAENGEGFTSPNPIVGAVVVKEGRVVGRGWHAACGGPHAEVMALNEAGALAKGADLYVTLEPCNHTGRTPPCTEKICAAGIRRVVVARRDPNPEVTGGGLEYLQSRGLAVTEGVCATEAGKQLEWFEKYVRTRTPFVTLKCALTLDGRIATRTGDSRWVTGPTARNYVHRMRQAVDAIMVGLGTVRADNPRLTVRLEGRRTKNPVRIILDTRLSLSEEATVANPDATVKTIIVTGGKHAADKRRRLEEKGVQVLDAPVEDNRIRLDALMTTLGEMEITSLLIEGGAQVSGSALAAGVVDKVCFFYAPRILGGDDGVPVCSGKGPDLMKEAIAVREITVTRFDQDILLEGYLS